MARACLVLFLVSFVIACDFTNGYLTQGRNLEAVFTKDAPAPQDLSENNLGLESAPVEVLAKQCAKIGEFCNNNSDCCSHSCLGFKKRCVS
ncbi:uncharacterized protein LOC123868966 isoform X2 [Maniola jurtina]|uniref:uncharacterized protein LOC123868966 isoform X2 n=1 Tax=Maniola jurtina TaxID=191418 RepID=UPI001E688B02|nr:uncharacterized protein LOC123868966 isoform X2 [Maniola jurtina]